MLPVALPAAAAQLLPNWKRIIIVCWTIFGLAMELFWKYLKMWRCEWSVELGSSQLHAPDGAGSTSGRGCKGAGNKKEDLPGAACPACSDQCCFFFFFFLPSFGWFRISGETFAGWSDYHTVITSDEVRWAGGTCWGAGGSAWGQCMSWGALAASTHHFGWLQCIDPRIISASQSF